ncbi:related to O-Methyltransferase involved in polyketide biosynthesis [Cephalotrichum gorgonifer]|uniref:Related to O-Methyltransferase involved in polyketide biosynthesis n=1 Tax=Cephalotrichum gorgonifer TaxID=2041049 RepID=A0AAE8MNU2_9PEZI|nr:related to O-Methyltransferase involved in polyketide biosynthesis [Cephalotrichum gorgonifer]
MLPPQPSKAPVSLTGVAETLLIPLASRASDVVSGRPILGDRHAKDVLDRLDYDSQKVALGPVHNALLALRTRLFDVWTTSFLGRHPRATVLHLACGLDARVLRVEWGKDVRWIDLDLPEVVALRREVLPDSVPGRDYRLLGASITGDDEGWLEEIPRDGKLVVIMEGLLSYLAEETVERLLRRFVEGPWEGELLFSCISPVVLKRSLEVGAPKAVRDTGAAFQSAVESPEALEDLYPGMKLLESISAIGVPGVEQAPVFTRFLLYLLSWIPSARDSGRYLRFQFGDIG